MIRMFEAFAGYGSQALAMDRAGIPYEVVGISEILPSSVNAYHALHGHIRNFGDICKIDWNRVPDFDFFTYSFPCTDISHIGDMGGLSEGSGTRSSLLWECCKAIEAKRPTWCLMENVRDLLSAQFKPEFDKWLDYMKGMGYNNYYKIIDAQPYTSQHRERVFMVSIQAEADRGFQWPTPPATVAKPEDILLDTVPSRHYLHGSKLAEFIGWAKDSIADCLPDGTDGRYLFGHSRDSEGKVANYHKLDVAHCCTTGSVGGGNVGMYVVERKNGQLKVRKFTAFEQMRLMGLEDSDIKKLYGIGLSTKQIGDMGGNSIVVDVLVAIYGQMWPDMIGTAQSTRSSIYMQLFQ